MTAIRYPDCRENSASGRYTVEARSPHNGEITRPDGTVPSDDYAFKYRDHQSAFRYRLIDNEAEPPGVVWERFQADREDSPHEILVSDDGWTIIRTHGFSPELIAVGIDGRDVLRIRLESEDEEPDFRSPGMVWELAHLAHTTAGLYWSSGSWRCFFRHEGRTAFTWRAWWGQRLVLDLERGAFLTDRTPIAGEFLADAIAAEQAGVLSLLADLSGRMDEVEALFEWEPDPEDELRPALSEVDAALHLVGVHRIREAIPYLRQWERLDVPVYERSTFTMPDDWSLEGQRYRPIAQSSLKRLGEDPAGYPAYQFVRELDLSEETERHPLPAHLPDRATRAQRVHPGMTAPDVLGLLGSPDFVHHNFRRSGELHSEVEDWEYDHKLESGWTTFRIRWEEIDDQPALTEVAWLPPDWLESTVRDAEFLG